MNTQTAMLLTTSLLLAAGGALAADEMKAGTMGAPSMQECKDHMAMAKDSSMKKDDMAMKKDAMCQEMMKKDEAIKTREISKPDAMSASAPMKK